MMGFIKKVVKIKLVIVGLLAFVWLAKKMHERCCYKEK
ncbi:MAG: hypothetical protein A4E48_02193 [Methanosaeta sp. PtaU1.Bin060]|jgi:hypothetical protein|nr:MAG: hypothetical protein A4E48_02193 [Methanosaeta sp. PtaU1.Bin060]